MKQNKDVLEKYTIKVGDKSYNFQNIGLEQSPSGRWTLTYGVMHRLMKAVSAMIVLDQSKALSFDELEFLVKTAEINYSDLAKEIQRDKSTISKWKGKTLPISESFHIKDIMLKLIFSDVNKRSYDPEKTFDYLSSRAGLPKPEVEAA